MGNFRLACIICAFLIQFTIAELEITVEPKVIWPGLTPKLVLNCSLTNNGSAEKDFINVLEISLSRYNETRKQFDDLLSQLINSSGVKQLVELRDAQISSGSQFLTLTLHNPTQNDANKYRCIAKGITRLNKYYSIDAYDKVESSNITEYTEEIKRLRKRETELMTIKDTDKCSPTNVSEKEKPTLNFQGNSMTMKEYIQPLTLKCSFTGLTNDTKQNLSVNFMNIIH
uniref:Ig-like domain-containing protein n=1 Tax=Biomphalaria glabrata TaxID=6526 RepID=A0A2C9JP64_BIOGL